MNRFPQNCALETRDSFRFEIKIFWSNIEISLQSNQRGISS